MKVEIWSDIACPWCYIGKRRFEHALDGWDGAVDVDVTWRSFQLDPTIPPGTRRSQEASLAAKYGLTMEQVRAMNDRVAGLAAAEGLDYHFDRYVVVNTFDAHRLAHFGKAHRLGPEVHERLMHAQLIDGDILDDQDTLVRLATEVGLPSDEARAALESNAYADEVAADIRMAQALGVDGVPFFVIDRRFGISGAQPAELFREALEAARAESTAP